MVCPEKSVSKLSKNTLFDDELKEAKLVKMKSDYEALKSKQVEREKPLKGDFYLEAEEVLYEEEDLY